MTQPPNRGTPNPDFFGVDAFTYTAADGHGGFDTAVITVTVTAVNDPPIAVDDSYTTTEDTSLAVAAPGVLGNDSDPDGDPLSATLVTWPASGVLALALNLFSTGQLKAKNNPLSA